MSASIEIAMKNVIMPKCFNGRRRARVLFETYKAVADYPSGAVVLDDPTIEITVVNGNHLPSGGAAATIASAHAAESAVASAAALESYDVVFIYLGLRAFDEAIKSATAWRRRGALLVAVTCDCESSAKLSKIRLLVDRGILATAIITEECGGRQTMRRLLHSLLASWPARSAPPAPRPPVALVN